MFGHICRMDKNRKIKDIMFGMVEGMKGKDDLTKSGWMTSGNGVKKLLYTNFIELLVKSLLVLQNFSTARKSGNIS